MTHLHMIYVATGIGAVVFFIAGATAMALRRRPAAVGDRVPALDAALAREQLLRANEARLQGELERQRHELAAARSAQHGDGQLRETKLVDELAVARRREADLATQLAHAVRTIDVARRREGDLGEQIASARKREADLAAQLAATRTREAELGDELTAARAGELQRRADLAVQLERARGDLTVAARELDLVSSRASDLERQLAERARAVRDLSTENEHLKGRLRDAEALRGEYVRLRTAETDTEYLKSEVARLEAELRAMHVEALGISRPRQARGSVQPRSSSVRTIGESLTTVIDRFADDGTRSIAVADKMGFPLASSGNDGVALAAYAALLLESATKSRQFLPLGTPACIELVDVQGTRVSVWTFEVDGDALLLANVAVTAVESTRVENALAELGAILAPTQLRAAGR